MGFTSKSESNRKFSPILSQKLFIWHQKSIQFDDFKSKFNSDQKFTSNYRTLID